VGSHTKMTPVVGNRAIRVRWSNAPSRRAIIFVHGYNGDTVKTWKQFDDLLPSDPNAAGYDLIFYGYDGLYGTTWHLSQTLCAFLTQFNQFPGGLRTTQPAPAPNLRSQPYDRVIVVAHSLGAILARWALIMANNQGSTWMPNTELVLFAPAHNGARPGELLRFAFGGLSFLRFFGAYALYQSPLIDELDSGSGIFRQFRGDVTRALQSGNCPYLRARRVIQANKERVVHNGPFGNDPPLWFPAAFVNADHSSVCKPTSYFLAPFEAVRSLLP
jgi:pimeloyl-ACP methyl ester carboxylesterase